MDIWDAFCDNVLCPVGSLVGDAVEGTARLVDSAVQIVVIDGVCGGIDRVVDTVKENPVESAIVAGAAVATGGAAFAFAGPIAAALGSAGALGTASTGTVIGTLSGAALESASLAALGGGAVAAGGAGMAGGTAVVTAVGGVAGAATTGGAIAATKS